MAVRGVARARHSRSSRRSSRRAARGRWMSQRKDKAQQGYVSCRVCTGHLLSLPVLIGAMQQFHTGITAELLRVSRLRHPWRSQVCVGMSASAGMSGRAMHHSQHALGAPSGRSAVRLRLRARGFSRRAGRQGQSNQGPSDQISTGLPGCSARTRSTGCRRGPAPSGRRGCPAPPVSPRSRRCR